MWFKSAIFCVLPVGCYFYQWSRENSVRLKVPINVNEVIERWQKVCFTRKNSSFSKRFCKGNIIGHFKERIGLCLFSGWLQSCLRCILCLGLQTSFLRLVFVLCGKLPPPFNFYFLLLKFFIFSYLLMPFQQSVWPSSCIFLSTWLPKEIFN